MSDLTLGVLMSDLVIVIHLLHLYIGTVYHPIIRFQNRWKIFQIYCKVNWANDKIEGFSNNIHFCCFNNSAPWALTRIDNVTLQCLHLNLQGRYNQLSNDFSIEKLILYLDMAL